MSKAKLVFERGPLSFSANVNITGGLLVEPDSTTGRIKPATAGTVACLGVAMGDASAVNYANADTTDAWGNNITNFHFPPNEVAVAYQGVFRLKAFGAITFGQLVVSGLNVVGTNGIVVPRVAQVLDQVIGRCVEPGGIADGAEGKILLGSVGW